jgi:tRNA threonylcarbamoyladenosine biosynthesis protein TsaE
MEYQISFDFMSSSVTQTIACGRALGALLLRGDLVLLYGEVGAGKTHFSKGMVAGAGSHDTVTSPTFVFINEYRASPALPIFHVDLYRVESHHELDTIGLDDATSGAGICIIEWPERDPRLVEVPHVAVHFSHVAPHQRRIHVHATAGRPQLIATALRHQLPALANE